MEFTLSINLENEAFSPDFSPEVARILRRVADQVEAGITEGKTRDINGNTVGSFSASVEG